jgi:hypothetical protein
MRANNTKPGIAKYTHLNERRFPKKPPRFPYTYDKNARVSFLDQIQVLPYQEVDPPKPSKIPIPYSLLSEIQLLWLLGGKR